MTRIGGTRLFCAITVCLVFLSVSASRSAEKACGGRRIADRDEHHSAGGARINTAALNPGLPDLPDFTVDHPISTVVSPDGGTLLILTSGYNRNNDARAKAIPAADQRIYFCFRHPAAKAGATAGVAHSQRLRWTGVGAGWLAFLCRGRQRRQCSCFRTAKRPVERDGKANSAGPQNRRWELLIARKQK